jgi:dGTPase
MMASSDQATSPYEALIRPDRLRKSSFADRDLETEMLSDKARIVTSSAFRRLQTKAQVFSLEKNASIRTRLTHTLEVAMFGELIAGKAFSLCRRDELIGEKFRVPFITTVENSCLLHDAGNPPFGHLGEFAICDWFTKREPRIKRRWRDFMEEDDIEAHYFAFKHFDGNPQGLRIVTRLQWLKDEYGLNLTCTLLAAIVKYLTAFPDKKSAFRKKAGFFETERELVSIVWKRLGLQLEGDNPAQRHPLTFLMEAADDIAYCVSDIEDALVKHVVTEEFFFDQLQGEVREFIPGAASVSSFRSSRFLEFRIQLTRYLVDCAAQMYRAQHDLILEGRFTSALLDMDPRAKDALSQLKKFAKLHIFSSKEAVDIELSGFQIVQSLLKGFERLFLMTPDEFKRLRSGSYAPGEKALEKRLLTLLSSRHLLAYDYYSEVNPRIEPALRAHLLVDYISGMTDSHAVKIFNMLTGTSVGVDL